MSITSDNFKNIFEFTGNQIDASAYRYSGPNGISFSDEGTNPDIVGTIDADRIYGDAPGGILTGGKGADSISLFAQATTVAYHADDTGITASTLDTVDGFRTGPARSASTASAPRRAHIRKPRLPLDPSMMRSRRPHR